MTDSAGRHVPPVGVLGHFQLPDAELSATVLDLLHGDEVAGLAAQSPRGSRIVLLDTFDRRLQRKGLTLEAVAEHRSGAFLLSLRSRTKLIARTRAPGPMPKFLADLPIEPLRGALEPVIEMRALLPRLELVRYRDLIGRHRQSVDETLGLYRDRYILADDGARSQEVCRRLTFETPDHPTKALRRLIEHVAALQSGVATDDATLDVWGEVLVRFHGLDGMASDEVVPIDPGLRADLALKRFLAPLAQAMRRNEPGLIERIDTEFLHDFRVAVRRSRSALGQLRGTFPPRVIGRFTRDLAWLGQITGPPRDLDVYLLEFDRQSMYVPESLRDDLAPLRSLLEQAAADAHRGLVRQLAQRRYRSFMADWAAFLDKPCPEHPTAPDAMTPIEQVLTSRIVRLHRRIGKRDTWRAPDAEPEALHALRKTCKKLRYLLEFAQRVSPAAPLQRPIKTLKALQSHLGAFQDAEVQSTQLLDWSASLYAGRKPSDRTFVAIGALIAHLDRVQRRQRAQVPAAVKAFARKEQRQELEHLLSAC
ncbi:MAG: CHAD domain-containing protein [Methylotetracoccus sp.]